MFRDPLYRQIRRALRDLKDGDGFERCANDLLSNIYPSLAPREGGNDAGLDGLITNEDNTSIQLICTTGQDVLANLSKSIESNLKKGGNSHACILATSQQLTNPKKRALEERARNLGRPLIQSYDQAGMAQLLYRDTGWLKELLGLTGDPPPLSLFPLSNRPLFDVPPLGRDEDLFRIITSRNDVVLVGQPGSGKTHLLFTAAKKAKGRFVVDKDISLVAQGLRDFQPHFLIVDDAHSHLDFLKRLKLLRQQIDARVRIVASCWPGQEEPVCTALQIPNQKCHLLEGLSPKQIKEVIQSQRIFGPPHLIAEIIHQSQGKPGLAVTLCRLCWESGARDVVLGNALARDVKLSFEPLLGQEATYSLACFAIGGSAGMTLEAVARLSGKNALDVKRLVEQLAAAGVLDVAESRISVHPARLRQALVRDVILKPPLLDLTPYLLEGQDFAATTRVLIEAQLLGGVLPDGLVRQRLEQLASTSEQEAFEEYAQLGKNEAEWILDNFPEKLKAVAAVALLKTPHRSLDMLLSSAIRTRNERSSQGYSIRTEEIIPEIKRWVLAAKPDHEDAYKRREILATSLEKEAVAKKDRIVAILAAKLVLSIKHEDASSPPGEPMTITIHSGIMAQNQLSKIASLWPKILPIFCEADPSQGREIADVFHQWVHPGFHGKDPPKEYENESRKHARRMMAELLGALAGNWTMHHHLRRYAEKLDLHKAIESDPIAEVLFPSHELADWRKAQERQQLAADRLADEWKKNEPDEVVKILTTAEAQARAAGISCTSWDRHVCYSIAETTNKPAAWINALFKQNASARLIEPFLDKLAVTDSAAAKPWISAALDSKHLRDLGVCTVVQHYLPQSSVWAIALPHFKECAYSIGMCVLHGNVKKENAKALLHLPDRSVSSAVAVHLWNKSRQIPNELLQDWKNVIVEHVDDVDEDHVLVSVFKEYPDVAFQWIARRLDAIHDSKRAFWFGIGFDRALAAALHVLTREQRRELIDKMPRTSAVSELARSLVGRNMELYLHLLSREELEGVRLDPLRLDGYSESEDEDLVYEFDEGWQKMALAAIDKGFLAEEIFYASQAGSFSYSGSMSSMYGSRLAAYEKLLKHSDARLRKVGEIGFEHFSRLKQEYGVREKRAALRGEIV